MNQHTLELSARTCSTVPKSFLSVDLVPEELRWDETTAIFRLISSVDSNSRRSLVRVTNSSPVDLNWIQLQLRSIPPLHLILIAAFVFDACFPSTARLLYNNSIRERNLTFHPISRAISTLSSRRMTRAPTSHHQYLIVPHGWHVCWQV